jgi:hypothetical protein
MDLRPLGIRRSVSIPGSDIPRDLYTGNKLSYHPAGTGSHFLHPFQAVNCQATFLRSLRDNSHARPFDIPESN